MPKYWDDWAERWQQHNRENDAKKRAEALDGLRDDDGLRFLDPESAALIRKRKALRNISTNPFLIIPGVLEDDDDHK